MNYLLDTHILIWAIINPQKLSKKATTTLTDPENRIIVSSINFWEIALKFSLKKLELVDVMPEDFISLSKQAGFTLKDLTAEESGNFYKLTATYHKDSFDRMLIWQAIHNNYTLVSDDTDVKKYAAVGLKVVW